MAETDIRRGLQDFWGLLDDDQRAVISNRAIVQSYSKGESLYKVGEDSTYLVCVLSGHIKLEKLGVGGRMQITRMFCPGENFGYRSYFAKQDHQTEAVAMVPTQVALVPMDLIEKICMMNAELAMYFVRNLATDLGVSDERTITLTQKHIRGRLAESITMLVNKYGFEADGMTINAALSREDIMARTGYFCVHRLARGRRHPRGGGPPYPCAQHREAEAHQRQRIAPHIAPCRR